MALTILSLAVLLMAYGASALNCYHVISVQTMGMDLGDHNTEMHCKENSVCMLVEAKISRAATPATVFFGYCFPASETATTGCKDVLNNMGNTDTVGSGGVTIDSCKLSFCSGELCNDINGPALPAHQPTSKIVGDPIECYAIQKVQSSLGTGNKNEVSKVTCAAGASCYISKAKATASMSGMSFDMDITSGGCKLAPLCEYDECKWMLREIQGMMPASIHINWDIKSCASACCADNLCNDADVSISSLKEKQATKKTTSTAKTETAKRNKAPVNSPSNEKTVSGLSPAVIAVLAVIGCLVVIAVLLVAFVASRRSKPFSFGPLIEESRGGNTAGLKA